MLVDGGWKGKKKKESEMKFIKPRILKSKQYSNYLGQYEQNAFRKYVASFLRFQEVELYHTSNATPLKH